MSYRILLVRLSSIGDIVHAYPVVCDLKHYIPNAKIDWLVDDSCAHLVRANALIDNIRVIQLRKWTRKKIYELLPYVLLILPILLIITILSKCFKYFKRKQTDIQDTYYTCYDNKCIGYNNSARHYDYIIDLHGFLKSSLASMFVASGKRYGFSYSCLKEPLAGLFYNYRYDIENAYTKKHIFHSLHDNQNSYQDTISHRVYNTRNNNHDAHLSNYHHNSVRMRLLTSCIFGYTIHDIYVAHTFKFISDNPLVRLSDTHNIRHDNINIGIDNKQSNDKYGYSYKHNHSYNYNHTNCIDHTNRFNIICFHASSKSSKECTVDEWAKLIIGLIQNKNLSKEQKRLSISQPESINKTNTVSSNNHSIEGNNLANKINVHTMIENDNLANKFINSAQIIFTIPYTIEREMKNAFAIKQQVECVLSEQSSYLVQVVSLNIYAMINSIIHADFIFGVDTGLIHFANFLHKPAIALFKDTNPEIFGLNQLHKAKNLILNHNQSNQSKQNHQAHQANKIISMDVVADEQDITNIIDEFINIAKYSHQ